MIVVVRRRGEIRWFDSDLAYWVLDQRKWAQSFDRAGYDIDVEDHADRFGIAVVDEHSAPAFLSCMQEFAISRESLRGRFAEAFAGASVWFDIADSLPSLFVDFDRLMLWSVHSEGVSLESYVPSSWCGVYEKFSDQLPNHERYWEQDGVDLTSRFRTAQ